MSHRRRDRRADSSRTTWSIGAGLILTWVLFAFGAVYPWASRPAAAATLLLFLAARPRLFDDSTRALDAGVLALVAYAWLQIVPLPPAIVNALSPGSAAFQETVRITPFDPSAWRPLSLQPLLSVDACASLTAAALFYWIVRASAGRAGGRQLIRWIAIIGALAVVEAVLQPLLFPNGRIYGFWTPQSHEAQPMGPIISRNHFASWMILAVPLTAGYVAARAHSHWVNSTDAVGSSVRALGDTKVLAMAGCMAIMLAGVLVSQSRAGLIGMTAASVLGLAGGWRQLGGRGRLALLAAALILGLATTWVTNPARVVRRFETTTEDDWGGRPVIWRATRRLIAMYPIAGVGIGAYEGVMPAYQEPPRTPLFNHAHSQYLQWAAEGGLVGAGVGLWVILAGVRLFVRRQRFDRGPLVHLRGGALAAVFGLAVQSIWETPLVTPALLWMLAAAAALATGRSASGDAPAGAE